MHNDWLDPVRTAVKALGEEEIIKRYSETGERWQNRVVDFIHEIKPDIVVETGVYVALSTRKFLTALDTNDRGNLYSCDPDPIVEPKHPRWTLVREPSYVGLPKLFETVGPWYMFIHDSDHDVECQTYEYELAYRCVKAGGYILSDDYTWGTPQHYAWDKFVAKYDLPKMEPLGSCAITQKFTASTPDIKSAHAFAIKAAREAAIAYGVSPNYA